LTERQGKTDPGRLFHRPGNERRGRQTAGQPRRRAGTDGGDRGEGYPDADGSYLLGGHGSANHVRVGAAGAAPAGQSIHRIAARPEIGSPFREETPCLRLPKLATRSTRRLTTSRRRKCGKHCWRLRRNWRRPTFPSSFWSVAWKAPARGR